MWVSWPMAEHPYETMVNIGDADLGLVIHGLRNKIWDSCLVSFSVELPQEVFLIPRLVCV